MANFQGPCTQLGGVKDHCFNDRAIGCKTHMRVPVLRHLALGGFVNPPAAAGAAIVLKYNIDPPERLLFGWGKALIGGCGAGKIDAGTTHRAASACAQQECMRSST